MSKAWDEMWARPFKNVRGATEMTIASQAVAIRSGNLVDDDAIKIGELYEQGRSCIVDSVRYLIECGQCLAEKKASLKHGEWLPWLRDNAGVLGFGADRTARKLMKAAKVNRTLKSDLDEGTAAQISRKLWGNQSSQLVQQSLSNEHYTPAAYLDAARKVLGEIDLDPASCEEANAVVKAKHFFAESDDGLTVDWYGNIWLNPPYGGSAGEFVVKLVENFRAGNVSAAVVLVNAHCTDTSWFQLLWDGVLCFTDHRINFYGDDTRSGSTHGSVFVYFGSDEQIFAREFKQFGAIVKRIP